jgi:hypothetical protein
MHRVYEITIPGLSLTADLPLVRRRLLADFPRVLEVLATTTPATMLIVYLGEDEIVAWLASLAAATASRRRARDRSGAGTATAA